MRESIKSLLSFSWAMSMFGVQQTTNLLSSDQAARAFDSVTEVTRGQLAEVLQTTFNAGDKLQRGAVDMTLGMFSGEAFSPSKWMRMASDAAKQSADAVTKGMQGATATVQQAASTATPSSGATSGAGNASTASQRQGWGPMPS